MRSQDKRGGFGRRESCWGLGEGVVTGEIDADRFTVDKVTFDLLDRHHGNKELAYRFDPAVGSVHPVPVEESAVHSSSLSDDEVVALARLAKRIERHYARPMDIEWAIGRTAGVADLPADYYILQARPETVASQARAQEPHRRGSALDLVVGDLVARRGK